MWEIIAPLFHKKIALVKSSIYELFNKYSVVVVRLTPSLPQRGKHPKGNPLDPLIMQNFQLTSLPSEGPTRRPSDPQRGGNARKIQKTSFVNRWFELNFKNCSKC
jgi:hypothetical protein